MLCGVGGPTIHAAKQALSYSEALAWRQYRDKRGRLNPMLRTEVALGRLAVVLLNAMGVKKQGGGAFEVADFVPHLAEPVEVAPENEMALILQKFGAR